MNDWKSFFKNKRITVMGLGLLGRGVGDVEFLAQYAKEIIVTDLKSHAELKPSLAKLKKFKNISYVLGKHELKDFENRDFILKSANVPLDSKFIAYARKQKVPVYMSTALFAKLTPAKIVGITGTRGKSTVSQMVYESLKKSRGKRKLYLGGNIQGVSTLPFLSKAKKGDIAVLELDSWQLQGFGDLKISPSLAVFTTFMPDHLNYYHNDLSRYFEDKTNIFKHQKPEDVLIAGDQLKKLGAKFKLPARTRFVSVQNLPMNIKLKIVGTHNRYNAAVAYATLLALDVSPTVIKKSFESFKGVPGRLELIAAKKGIQFYNDTTATTPHALATALEALGKRVVLICGGTDKSIDLSVLKSPLKNCKNIILLPGSGTNRLIEEKILPKSIQHVHVKNMKEAVREAVKFAKKGDIILMSPGFTSFGLFKNEYDRGEQFVKLVKAF